MIKFCLQAFTAIAWMFALIIPGHSQMLEQDSLLQRLTLVKGDTSRVPALIDLSKWYLTNDYPKARLYADSALSTALATTFPKLKARSLSHRGLVYWHNGEYADAIKSYNDALAIEETLGNTFEIGVDHHGIAMVYYYEADYASALSHHQKALAAFRKSANLTKVALVLNHIGLIYHKMGEYPKAIPYLLESSEVQQQIPGYSGRINSFAGSSPFFRMKTYWNRELSRQLDLLKSESQKARSKNMLNIFYNIGSAYRELKDPRSALGYYLQAKDYALSIGRAPDYFELGIVYKEIGEFDSALQVHKLAMEQALQKGTRLNILWGHIVLGEDFFAIGNYAEALANYQQGIEMSRVMGNKLGVAARLQRMAALLVVMNRQSEAWNAYVESIQLAEKIGAKLQIRDGSLALAELLASMGNHRDAYYYQKKGKQLADSLTAGEADLQFAQMQVQYELDKKSEDIERLNQEKQIQKAKIRNKDLLIFGALVVLMLCLLLVFSTYRRYRQKNRDNKILQEQKTQIETLLAEIHHRVKNNLQVISSLLSIQSDQLKSKNARMAVLQGQSRVQAMGLIHENIYKTESFAFISMDEYIHKLGASLVESFGLHHAKLNIVTHDVAVDVDTAIPLGLIINELLTNSFKHAFRNVENPVVEIDLRQDGARMLTLKVSDNGNGYLVSSDRESFGLKLVKELTRQLGGAMEFPPGPGFCICLRFKKYKLAA